MKNFLLKSWLMLCLLVFGVGTSWAETVTYTWTYSSSKFNVSSSGTAPAGSSATLTSTYKNANQLTGTNTQTFTLSGYDDCTITGVSINLKRSSSASAKANITVSANGGQIGSSSNLTLTTSQADYGITITSTKIGTGKNIVITVNAAANSIYVYNYKITYEAANKTATTTTFGNGVDNQNFDFTQGDAPFTKTATLSPTGIGSLTYSSSNSAVASVNSSTGEVTIGQAGKATIKAEYAGDANYAKSSAEYTVTVAPKGTPVTYTITSTTAVSTAGTAPNGSAATYSQTYSNAKGQMTGSNSTTLTLSGYAGCKINCIKLNMKSNGSSGAGTFSAVAGTTTLASIAEATTFDKWFDNTEYTTSYKDVLVTMDNTSYVIGDDENLVINITATTSSLYINSYTIYYDLAIPAAEKPVITPADGTEFAIAPQQVTITSAPGATIYYTLDGSTPDDTKTLYEGAFDISETTTVKAIAYETDKRPSAVVSATLAYVPNYNINCNAPEGGSYTVKVANNEAQTITESTTIIGGQGKTITLTTTPSAGYKLASTPFTVKDADEAAVSVSKDGDNYTFTMPGKNVTITANYSRVYTITAGTFEHGEITAIKDKDDAEITETSKGSKVVVEASADPHWNLATMYYVKEGDDAQIAITESEGVYSFTMPQSNVTVYATYTEDPKFNVSWVVNGTEVKAENVYGDVAVSAPAVSSIGGKVFRGWVEDEIDTPTNTAPSFVVVAGLTVNADKVFYAVFATQSGSLSNTFGRISDPSTLQDGDVIAITGHGSTTNNKAIMNTAFGATSLSAAESNGTITVTSDAQKWTLVAVNGGWNLTNNGKTLGVETLPNSSTTNADASLCATNNVWTIDVHTESSSTVMLHNDNVYIDYYNGKWQSYYQTRGNGSSSVALRLYKAQSDFTYSNYTTSPAAPVNINVTSVGWGTYYNADAYVMPAGLEGYIMQEVDGNIKSVKAYEEGDVVPVETGLLLKNSGNYTLNFTTGGDASKAEGNLLHGNLEAGLTTGGGAGAKYYKLANGENGLGWYFGDAETQNGSAFEIAENKAYLVINSGSSAPAYIGLEDDEDAIMAMPEETKLQGDLYNVAGQKVSKNYKGIVIVNGKKMLNK